jgi:Flp pilus assembly protein TadG
MHRAFRLTAPRRRRPRSRGQSLAEFAIVFPVLMIVLGGIIQFGLLFWGQNTLTQIARDTGRWASTQTDCNPVTAQVPLLATAKSIAQQSSLIGNSSSWNYGPAPNNVEAAWTINTVGAPCPPVDNTQEVFVTITIRHTVPIFFPFVPGNGALVTQAQFRMEPRP